MKNSGAVYPRGLYKVACSSFIIRANLNRRKRGSAPELLMRRAWMILPRRRPRTRSKEFDWEALAFGSLRFLLAVVLLSEFALPGTGFQCCPWILSLESWQLVMLWC